MPIDRFAAVVRTCTIARDPTRRDLARALVGLAAGTALAPLFDPMANGALAKGKGKKKKKKGKTPPPPSPPPPPSCALQCGFDCCPQTQPECCHATGQTLCYGAGETCCPNLGGQSAEVCPPGTRCEFIDDPDDTLGPYSFCCPASHATCGYGCCPPGTVCCPVAGDFGRVWKCCADSSCDELSTECSGVGDHIVDHRTF
jgi:hypothetical protein